VNNVAFSLPLCHRGRRLWTYNHKMALRGQRILVLHHQSGLQLTVFYAFVPRDWVSVSVCGNKYFVNGMMC